jgi:hypothetical protein
MKKILSFLVLLCCTLKQTNAFAPPSHRKTSTVQTKASSSPIGDLFSGIIGVAPSSLQPPSDVLSGTSIDPARDDVDLGRVYKVRGGK